MDSLTQIVLGAAVGEVVLGKKIGNRAMLWGAVAGTIPDLDVMIASVFMNEVNGLAFHRAITHSIFFAVTFSFLMARYTQWLYSKGHHKHLWYRSLALSASGLFFLLVAGVFILIGSTIGGLVGGLITGIPSILAAAYFTYRTYESYFATPQPIINIGWKSWYMLFFWCIFTHPLLDCLTVYGTQLFAPFTNYRVGLNNISVADPLYTLPFLTCLLFAVFLRKKENRASRISNQDESTFTFPVRSDYATRKWVNWLGILISSLYIVWTFYNKSQVNKILEDTLQEEKITYNRYMTGPTILNNVLWSGTVETDDQFYTGQYSFFDNEKRFKLYPIPKNHDWLDNADNDPTINTLRWFTNDYYGVIRRKDGRLQVNDLRYGTFSKGQNGENDFVFRFVLEQDENGQYDMKAADGGPAPGEEKKIFTRLWNRILGE